MNDVDWPATSDNFAKEEEEEFDDPDSEDSKLLTDADEKFLAELDFSEVRVHP